jgi:enamine deaminase RidA (YjgF/YER057c/UK114 family)
LNEAEADAVAFGDAGDFRAQAVQSFENLKAALAAIGAGFENVVKITSYFVDISLLPVFIEVRDRYVDTKTPPHTSPMTVRRWA